jgi:hypothetical protein
MKPTLFNALRADYDRQAGRSLAMPIAGALVWTIAAVAATQLDQPTATQVLLSATGAIFPIALVLARVLKEKLVNNPSPFGRLMGLCIIMVNLLWALHSTLIFKDASLVPLRLGIGLGLHWIVFSWIIDHPVGIIHAVLRTILVTALWWLFPTQPVVAVAVSVVIAYAYSIFALATRRLNQEPMVAGSQLDPGPAG